MSKRFGKAYMGEPTPLAAPIVQSPRLLLDQRTWLCEVTQPGGETLGAGIATSAETARERAQTIASAIHQSRSRKAPGR